MFYYKLADDGVHIDGYCRDKGHAKKQGFDLVTEAEPVMQGDGSGYVLPKDYVAPVVEYVPTLEERQTATEEAILDIYSILMGDDE